MALASRQIQLPRQHKKAALRQFFAPAKTAFPPSMAVKAYGCLQDVGKGREQERKLCTSRSAKAEPGFVWRPRRARPEGHICHVANLAKDNQPWPQRAPRVKRVPWVSACALHLGFGFLRRSTSCIPAVVHPSGHAESICHYSEVP